MDLTRTEPESAVQHFYRMELMPGLFGDWSLVREWGRAGQPGQIRIDWFDEEAQAKDARFAIQMEKAKKGYE
jgi:predicted DNA-binding WGR domain protein